MRYIWREMGMESETVAHVFLPVCYPRQTKFHAGHMSKPFLYYSLFHIHKSIDVCEVGESRNIICIIFCYRNISNLSKHQCRLLGSGIFPGEVTRPPGGRRVENWKRKRRWALDLNSELFQRNSAGELLSCTLVTWSADVQGYLRGNEEENPTLHKSTES